MTKYFFGFAKYFSGFKHNSWICKFVWDLQNNICEFNTFFRICNSFSDLINSSTMISKKHYDFNFFFRIFKTFFQISQIFWDCPLSASVGVTSKIEYVAFTLLTRGNSESDKSLNRFWIALKRKMTKKDNKALRSVLFITKFTKNLG